MSLTGRDNPERIWGTVATANYFTVLGVRPTLGRAFLPAEDEKPGGAPVAVISYRLWQTHFGANPDIVGQQHRNQSAPLHHCGRGARRVPGEPDGSCGRRFGFPIMMVQQLMAQGDLIHDHHYFWMSAMGRLKPGVRLNRRRRK